MNTLLKLLFMIFMFKPRKCIQDSDSSSDFNLLEVEEKEIYNSFLSSKSTKRNLACAATKSDPLGTGCDFCANIDSAKPYKVDDTTCVGDCGLYYQTPHSNGKICTTCSAYFNIDSNSCVNTCPACLITGVINSINVCKNCKTFGLGNFYNGACVASCPANYLIIDTTNNCCGNCDATGFYNSETNACVATCPTYLIPNSTSPKRCDNCKTLSLGFSYNGACVTGSSCPGASTLLDTNRNGCSDVPAPAPTPTPTPTPCLTNNGICVSSCPTGKIISNNTCICQKYILNSICVDTCPTSYIYDASKVCRQCNDYIFENFCLAACPINTATYVNSKTCLNWKNINKFLYLNNIVDQCPTGYSFDDKFQCIKCKDIGKLYLNGQCLDVCPIYFFVKDNNCITCKSTGKVTYNNICYDTCPLGSYLYEWQSNNQTVNNCFSCFSENKYLVYGASECVLVCPSFTTIYDSSKMCSKNNCLDIDKVMYNNICINSCPQDTYLNQENACTPLLICKYYYLNF